MATTEPAVEYRERLGRWQQQERRAERQSNQLGNLRLAVVAIAAALAYPAFALHVYSGWVLLAPLAVFIGLIIQHERIVRRKQLAHRGMEYYQHGLERLDDRWAGTGSQGGEFVDPAHVFANDLDIFGRGSLFELISTARTSAGERKLAGWFLHPAAPADVAERQQAVAEMRDHIQLREDLALLGEDIRAQVHADQLAGWGSAPPVRMFAGARWVALFSSVATIVTLIGFMGHWFGARPLVAAIGLAIALGFALRRPVAQVMGAADTPAHDLEIVALLLDRLERAQFEGPLLKRLRAGLDIAGLPASRRIGRLRRWMELLDSSEHLAVRVFGPAVLWRQQAAMAVEAWRLRTGPQAGRWIEAIAELEALSSLAAFSFERPWAAYPELVDDGPLFEARDLRHPLISMGRCVPNDVAVGGEHRLLIVSGSNMSGKSTLLRSIGLNTVLAWAGAPVTASRLLISPLATGASIRIVDSLQDGKSRFYAEITRLRQIVGMADQGVPVLFLLDELLSGTNSHDRRIGAEAVIRTLLARNTIGLVTTHDLALTRIQQEFGPGALNVHFEDHLEDGRISFDYRLKPGVVERSNALELMRAVGLEV